MKVSSAPSRKAAFAALAPGLLLLATLGGCAHVGMRPADRASPEEPAGAPPGVEGAPGAEVSEPAAGDVLAGDAVLPEEGDEEEEGEESRTPSPLDELGTTNLELGPEEVESERSRARSEPPQFDIPMEVNEKVLAWVGHYSDGQRKWFLPGLIRSGRYLPMFRRIFREEGLPEDLTYMAHVESGYKTTAYSRARAKGIFQFIASTGRRYGLQIDFWVDERSDPEKSARAAAAYLRKLYRDFGDWHLALAAYNAGEGRIRRAIHRTGLRDFWALARRGHFRLETRNYVPAVLAATLISKEPGKFGFEFEAEPPLDYETIRVEGAVDLRVLARCAGSDFETLSALNPALRRHQTPPGRTTDVRVPPGRGTETLQALSAVPDKERVLYVRHRVRRGDTLSSLARRYGVTVSSIQQANRMGRRTLLREGHVLVIPTAVAGGEETSDVVTYHVRRGDTLSEIARRHGTAPAAIAASSGIPVDKTLRVGEVLTVVPGARSAAAAREAVSTEREPVPQENSAVGPLLHTVRRGETLWGIAARYRTSVRALCARNQISSTDTLHPGTRLTIRD